jgi:hypothetical protein
VGDGYRLFEAVESDGEHELCSTLACAIIKNTEFILKAEQHLNDDRTNVVQVECSLMSSWGRVSRPKHEFAVLPATVETFK